MSRRLRVSPFLEQLEDRYVPATVKLVSGVLLISNPVVTGGGANLTLKALSNNQFEVKDNGASVGKYNVGHTIYIMGSNGNDSVTFDLNGKAYTGNLLINTMNGNDTISINSTVGAGNLIGGNVTLLTGLGNDTVAVNTASNKALTIGGSVLVSDQSAGGFNTFQMGNDSIATVIGGDLTITNATDNGATPAVKIGNGKFDRIGGNMTVSTPVTANNVGIVFGKVVDTSVGSDTFAIGTGIGKNLTITTGSGNDSVSFFGGNKRNGNKAAGTSFRTPDHGTTVGGDTHVNFGEGNNYFNVAGDQPTAVVGGQETIFSGNVTVVGGAGNDSIELSGWGIGSGIGTIVGGNLNLFLGQGNNDLGSTAITGTGANFGLAATEPTVFGDMNVVLGNGNNAMVFVGLQVQGNMNWTLGNGQNGTPAAPFRMRQPPDGRLNMTFGNGGNYLQLLTSRVNGSPYVFNGNIQFGNGNDTFELGGVVPAGLPGAPSSKNFDQGGIYTGRVDGGLQVSGDVFIHNTDPTLIAPGGQVWELAPNLIVSNFP